MCIQYVTADEWATNFAKHSLTQALPQCRLPEMPQMALHSSLFARISATTQELLHKNAITTPRDLSELLTPQQLASCPQVGMDPSSIVYRLQAVEFSCQCVLACFDD